ncbi:MAG: hypothetical protein AB1412_00395 [Pseudomonadota bacterium]
MPAVASTLRTAWFSMLMLLLGLMPFIHGHLGQPVQSGWHIHALSAVEEVQSSAQFDGLACLSSQHDSAAKPHGFALHAPEPSDVEPGTVIASTRLSQLRVAAIAAETPALPATLAATTALPAAQPARLAWLPASRQALPGARHGLPPPGQAPPLHRA